jgi:hypothetical protein
MQTVYNESGSAVQQRPADEVLHDLESINQRGRDLLARNRVDLTDDELEDDFDELGEWIRAVDGIRRVFRRWDLNLITLGTLAAAVRRQRLRLIPNEPAPASVS